MSGTNGPLFLLHVTEAAGTAQINEDAILSCVEWTGHLAAPASGEMEEIDPSPQRSSRS